MKRKSLKKSPSIYRFFTDKLIGISLVKIYIVFVLAIFVLAIFSGLLMLYSSIKEKQSIEAETRKVEKQIEFWQKVIKKYNNYRDAYFELAVLEYRLKNFAKSKYYLQKVLYLDPEFIDGLKLKQMLGS